VIGRHCFLAYHILAFSTPFGTQKSHVDPSRPTASHAHFPTPQIDRLLLPAVLVNVTSAGS
jgi:hypothetical protein